MKNLSLLLFSVFFLLVISGKALPQEKSKDTKEVQNVKVEKEGPVNTICPVSTEESDKNITYTYKGKTYALCCNSCLKKFKKDPEKYISRLSEDGKSIVSGKKK